MGKTTLFHISLVCLLLPLLLGADSKFLSSPIADSDGTVNPTKTECVMLDASGGNCLTTNGCTSETIAGTTHNYRTLNFATGADDSASWGFDLPANLSGTTAGVQFVWHSDHADCDGGADNDVCFTIDGDSFGNDGAWEAGTLGGTEIGTTDTCLADGDIMYSSAVTFTHSMSPSERAIVVVKRDVDGGLGTCGDDDYAQDAKLLAVRFCYEVDNIFSGE